MEYTRLIGPSDFRLLKLQPGRGIQPLESSLILSSLDDRLYKYTALSHTWGDLHNRRELTSSRASDFRFIHSEPVLGTAETTTCEKAYVLVGRCGLHKSR